MTQLDEHGARILAFVEHYQRQHHRSPTYREIGAAVGLVSNDHVARDLNRLVRQGYLSLTPGVSRSLVLLKTPRARNRTLSLPGLDSIAAKPKRDELSEIAAGLYADERDTFLLRAHGSAMHDALLSDGDLVVVKRSETFQDGDMCAIYLQKTKRTTLRYLYHDNGRVRTQSPHPDASPEHYRFSEIEIRGTVLAILRKRDMQ